MRARALLRELRELEERRALYSGVGCCFHRSLGYMPGRGPGLLDEATWEAVLGPWASGQPGPDGEVPPPLGTLESRDAG